MTARQTRFSQGAVGLVTLWVRCYTRHLPAPIAERRIQEIRADLHDHLAYEHAHGTADWSIALGVLARTLRGLVADASWRISHQQPPKGNLVKSFAAILVAALATAFLGVGAILYADADDAPGLGLIGFVLIAGGFAIGVRTGYRRGRCAAGSQPH